jgi:hypothetical protein
MPFDFHIPIQLPEGGPVIIANPSNYQARGHRFATFLDLTKNKVSMIHSLLDNLADTEGLEIVQRVTPMIGILNSEADDQAERLEENKLTHADYEHACELIAEMTASIIRHRGIVSTLEILRASEQEITEWISWYQAEARRYWDEMQTHAPHSKEWNEARNKFDRQAELLWQCKRRAGEL